MRSFATILFLCLFGGVAFTQDLWGGIKVDISGPAGDSLNRTNLNAIRDFAGIFHKRAGSSTALSSTSLADVTGLSFPVLANREYKFKATIKYSAAATTTGSAWSINGPTGTVSLSVMCGRIGQQMIASFQNAVNTLDVFTATLYTTGNIAYVEGIVEPTADGSYIIRGATEVAASDITVQAVSTIEWYEIK